MLTQLSLDFSCVAPSISTGLSPIPTALSVTPAESTMPAPSRSHVDTSTPEPGTTLPIDDDSNLTRTARESADRSNTLKALLGQRFYCHVCTRTHPPDSSQITVCAKILAGRVIPHPKEYLWQPELLPYHSRSRWLQQNGRWSNEHDSRFTSISQAIEALAFDPTPPVPLPSELATSDGEDHYRQRYDAWVQSVRDEPQRRLHRAEPLMAELDALLPLPYPIGPPTGTRSSDQMLIPDPPSALEIARVCSLFPLPPRPTVSGRIMQLAISRFGTHHRTRRVPLSSGQSSISPLTRLNTIFSANLYGWARSNTTTTCYFDRHGLGLDPAFWNSVSLYRGTLTLTTRPFTIRHTCETARS